MTEAEKIAEAADEVARAAEAYEKAKAKLARLLGVDRMGGGTPVRAEPKPERKKYERDPAPVSEPKEKGSRRALSEVIESITRALADGPISFSDIVELSDSANSTVSRHLQRMIESGEVVKSDGLYELARKQSKLSPREKEIAASGKVRADLHRPGDPPTAEERVLAALGSAPKKFTDIVRDCSLTDRGCSDALAELARNGKVTSWNGVWKLTEAA